MLFKYLHFSEHKAQIWIKNILQCQKKIVWRFYYHCPDPQSLKYFDILGFLKKREGIQTV